MPERVTSAADSLIERTVPPTVVEICCFVVHDPVSVFAVLPPVSQKVGSATTGTTVNGADAVSLVTVESVAMIGSENGVVAVPCSFEVRGLVPVMSPLELTVNVPVSVPDVHAKVPLVLDGQLMPDTLTVVGGLADDGLATAVGSTFIGALAIVSAGSVQSKVPIAVPASVIEVVGLVVDDTVTVPVLAAVKLDGDSVPGSVSARPLDGTELGMVSDPVNVALAVVGAPPETSTPPFTVTAIVLPAARLASDAGTLRSSPKLLTAKLPLAGTGSGFIEPVMTVPERVSVPTTGTPVQLTVNPGVSAKAVPGMAANPTIPSSPASSDTTLTPAKSLRRRFRRDCMTATSPSSSRRRIEGMPPTSTARPSITGTRDAHPAP